MPGLPSELAVYSVQHLPIIKAYADQLGLVGLINHYVPTEMDIDAGTVVLGLVLDTLSGRSPLYRLEEFFAQQATALLLGKAVPPQACTVRATMRFGLEHRYGHCDTTSRSVWGDYQFAETQALPFQVTDGSSKEK